MTLAIVLGLACFAAVGLGIVARCVYEAWRAAGDDQSDSDDQVWPGMSA